MINKGPLQIATLAPLTITGNFTQTAAGALGLDFAGDSSGQYGALAISGSASLDGGLGIDLTNGFTLATGDSFDILAFGSLTGPGFDALALDGAACSLDGRGHVDLRRRRASERSHLRHVAGPCRGACLGRIRTGGLVAHPRTLDLGDARVGLPRPRRARPAQARAV